MGRGKYFDDFTLGEEILTGARTITEADVVNFACLSGDFHPEHMDEEYARTSLLGSRVAHGVLTLAVATGLTNQTGFFEGTTISVLEMRVRYTGPVRFGDTIHPVVTVAGKKESRKADRGILTLDVKVVNQKGEVVLESEWTVLMRRH